METYIAIKNKMHGVIYRTFIKPICFQYDPEAVHNAFISFGKNLGSSRITRKITSLAFTYKNPMLEQTIAGIRFKNPIGLSAGFDKNAELTDILPAVGFGFAEVGSITAQSCEGNKGVRLKRIPEKKSILVNLGLNNRGAIEINKSLKQKQFAIPIGISIAKTNCKETVVPWRGVSDYLFTLKQFSSTDIGQYYTINISCPNAYGGQPFTNPKLYRLLLQEIKKLKIKKPIFVKLSPDLTKTTLDKLIALSYKYKITGFICTNLTKEHKYKNGGLSGKAVEKRANKMLAYIYKKTRGDFILIGVGGIFSAEDAYTKIKLGASLVGLITGMIYQGPQLISEINQGLVRLLKRDGYTNIAEAVGAAFKDNA